MPRSVSVEVGGVCGSCAAMLGIQGCHQRNHVIILAGGRCGFDVSSLVRLFVIVPSKFRTKTGEHGCPKLHECYTS